MWRHWIAVLNIETERELKDAQIVAQSGIAPKQYGWDEEGEVDQGDLLPENEEELKKRWGARGVLLDEWKVMQGGSDSLNRQLELARQIFAAFKDDAELWEDTDSFLGYDLSNWIRDLPESLIDDGRIDEGLALAKDWSALEDFEMFLSDTAVIYAKAGREDDARRQIASDIALAPDDPVTRISAGNAFQILNDLPAAEEQFRKACECDDPFDDFDAWVRLIAFLRETGRDVEAARLDADLLLERYDDSDGEKKSDGSPRDLPVFQPYVREDPKVGRNDPCPCGSGKKFKKCCGALA